jgi:hypothetical protein
MTSTSCPGSSALRLSAGAGVRFKIAVKINAGELPLKACFPVAIS